MQLIDLRPEPQDLLSEVLAGLAEPQKRLPPKLFYDEEGSQLFDRICEQEEYYPARVEMELLERYSSQIAAALGPGCFLFEFGSGAGRKTELLLGSLLPPATYAPIDLAEDMLRTSSVRLAERYPQFKIYPVLGDFTRELGLDPAIIAGMRTRAAFFPGSTLGNFEPQDAVEFLERVGRLVGPGGLLVLGVDFRKSGRVIEPAYNDARGITAKFNLNMLVRLNRELGADFDLNRFRHVAFFNSSESRLEMHLESTTDQLVRVAGRMFGFKAGETIHTECSYKYSPPALEALVLRAGYRKLRLWTDSQSWFGIYLLRRLAQQRK